MENSAVLGLGQELGLALSQGVYASNPEPVEPSFASLDMTSDSPRYPDDLSCEECIPRR